MSRTSHTYTRDCTKCNNNNDETDYDTMLCKMNSVYGKQNTNKINLGNFTPIMETSNKCANCNIAHIYYVYKLNDGLFTTNKIICKTCYNEIKNCEQLHAKL